MNLYRQVSAFVVLSDLALAVTGCSSASETNTPSGDYPVYSTAEDAIHASDVIVVGEVLSSTVELLYPDVATAGDEVTNPR